MDIHGRSVLTNVVEKDSNVHVQERIVKTRVRSRGLIFKRCRSLESDEALRTARPIQCLLNHLSVPFSLHLSLFFAVINGPPLDAYLLERLSTCVYSMNKSRSNHTCWSCSLEKRIVWVSEEKEWKAYCLIERMHLARVAVNIDGLPLVDKWWSVLHQIKQRSIGERCHEGETQVIIASWPINDHHSGFQQCPLMVEGGDFLLAHRPINTASKPAQS